MVHRSTGMTKRSRAFSTFNVRGAGWKKKFYTCEAPGSTQWEGVDNADDGETEREEVRVCAVFRHSVENLSLNSFFIAGIMVVKIL